jgi:N-glycosylase/DNA lyase
MVQIVRGFSGSDARQRSLPGPSGELSPGIYWGSSDYLFTPAFWAAHAWQCSLAGQLPNRHKLGSTLREEVAACMLGGYGIPAEVGLAAYTRLREHDLVNRSACEHDLRDALTSPLWINGRCIRYRFARQKARHLAAAFNVLEGAVGLDDLTDIELRNWLTVLPGIGLKTASWITRNYRDSDQVAIIDIHLFRAGRLAGIFPAGMTIERDYLDLERRFVAFADAITVRASQLDALIWDFMKRVGQLALSAFQELERRPPNRPEHREVNRLLGRPRSRHRIRRDDDAALTAARQAHHPSSPEGRTTISKLRRQSP